MFHSTRQRQASWDAAVDIAPLMDVVFILLLFFLVSAQFNQEEALPIERPASAQAGVLQDQPLRVQIAASGQCYVQMRPVALSALPALARAQVAKGEPQVLLVADQSVPTGRLAEVMDACISGGISRVSLATEPQEGGAP